MMEQDEEATVARIKRLQSEIIGPTVKEHHGRLVKTTGDGFLIEFASAAEAIRSALAIQARLESEPIQLRIGINL
jgi:adenylate cyclase